MGPPPDPEPAMRKGQAVVEEAAGSVQKAVDGAARKGKEAVDAAAA
mgnify:CR=1 FL=1